MKAVVITVSDACSRGEREDASGAALVELLTELGAQIVERKTVSDDLDPLSQMLREYAESSDVDVIITTGGTGLGPRDNTPEATLRVIEREAPGIAEAVIAVLHHNGIEVFVPPGQVGCGMAPLAVGDVETARETLEKNLRIFAELASKVPDHAVLCTNTSTLPVSEIAAALPPARRGRFLGVHFFNPPTTLPLVEIIPGSPKAVRESFAVIAPVLPHALDLLAGNTTH